MKQNMRLFERVLRWMFGSAMVVWTIAGGPWWGFFGVYFLFTGSFGFCPGYYALKINRP